MSTTRASTVGHLSRLRFYGFCCPCIESEEDNAARIAALSVQGVPVKWHRSVHALTPPGTAQQSLESRAAEGGCGNGLTGAERYIGKIVEKGFRALGELNSSTTSYVGIEATLDMVDGPFGPSIRVTPNWSAKEEHYFSDQDDGGITPVGVCRASSTKTVPLMEVEEVAAGDGWNQRGRVSCGVRVHGKSDAHQLVGKGKKLLLFDVHESALHGVTRDEVVGHMNTLLAW
eukprot:CAMPEP_0183294714 /NCGR_PEP_ID=MMETSP0160_2-20130417/2938_1 /TAXON_ID=2839 ORGANISM="Odontella Sinensis, Strain Grunow 1884" /NCGR_SAMPLE_ID=MMETSP0160_2 /ASSEMBLY_ACC=CAM_ASM_000250 /LENGTH=229 /DNA_ID=CAMNT_0025456073 /DNA_START=60 /DNA_END=746 /DNA_ORIENTATION=-